MPNPILIDINAFLISARTGGFSAAAREIGTTPSVVSKRVGRLEAEIGERLFKRSTRALVLTPEGERLQPELQRIVAELEDTLTNRALSGTELRGSLRIRTPTTVGAQFVGPAVHRFQHRNPAMTVELHLLDRPVNPLEDGFDISMGALPQSFGGVKETAFCPYPRVLVAAPSYLERHPAPQVPGEISRHDCLAFVLVGHTWTFEGPSGPVAVDIRARYSVNDSRVLLDAAVDGLGLAMVPLFLARAALAEGRLVELMPDYPVSELWFKALVPSHKTHRPEVIAFVEHMRRELDPAPWLEA
ncbi:LysR family transcriptional regulator [Psychromarinibacter sp. C21-152]|uniref:LysR family transcriptional regulator n=1 Tax=Psychromarinibacter sediminicola TaxID=3033385 RepID=A0AAE3NU00_9RHOB|nr:LysR family transcriptional regulator [Psychromarinibacter sediminicola]MDF0602007.1 LysR family transcriptional regulator [Psychromarinibacter sediminicola]